MHCASGGHDDEKHALSIGSYSHPGTHPQPPAAASSAQIVPAAHRPPHVGCPLSSQGSAVEHTQIPEPAAVHTDPASQNPAHVALLASYEHCCPGSTQEHPEPVLVQTWSGYGQPVPEHIESEPRAQLDAHA